MCIKILCYSTDTYLQYNIQGGNLGQYLMWSLPHKLVIFQQSGNFFAVFQIMRSKWTSWAGTRPICRPFRVVWNPCPKLKKETIFFLVWEYFRQINFKIYTIKNMSVWNYPTNRENVYLELKYSVLFQDI